MQHEDPRVDRSRGAVYQAEDSVASVMRSSRRAVRVDNKVLHLPAEVTFGTVPAIQSFVDRVLAHPETVSTHPDLPPVVVEARRGFRSATYADGRIQVPVTDPRGRWALARSVILHECAHHLAGVPGHGRPFRRALLHLYSLHLGEDAAALLAHLLAPVEGLPEPVRPDSHGIRRVAALLAKAESTSSVEEAEAYLAKATVVAQRHSVDLAVAAWSGGSTRAEPTHRMLTIGRPRAPLNKHLVSLLIAVAGAWSVPVDIGHGSTYVLLYGMPEDLDQVEAVYATASILMVTRAVEHVRSGAWRGTTYRATEWSGEARPVTSTVARNAFCLGFVSRVAARLAVGARGASPISEGNDRPVRPEAASGGRSDAELALRARDLAVSDYHRTTSRARGRWRGSASAAGSATWSRRAGEQAAAEYGRHRLAAPPRALEG